MIDRSLIRQIRQGMTVYSSDGEKLGKVIQCDASTFIIEKGFFFPKDFIARFDDVSLVAGDEIRLSRGRAQLSEGPRDEEELAQGSGSVWAGGGGQETVPTGRINRDEEEVALPRRPATNEDSPAINFGEDSGAIGRRDPDDEP